MSRWFASRWMVISVTLSALAFGLSIWLQDGSAFMTVATSTIMLGQGKNIMDGRHNNPKNGG